MRTLVAIPILIGTGAAAACAIHSRALPEETEWRRLLEFDVSTYATERGPLDGAPGASVIGFWVNRSIQGSAIITGLDRPALGVFVGMSTPNAVVNEPYGSLSVEFTLADGSTRRVPPSAGSGLAMLFQSPDDVPVRNLRAITLDVDAHAAWAR